ncbi:uncharacterized protein BDZ99DRAFT_508508 [Mytilinidion resinicola]|uniref:Cation efflux protein n=1 Tax=Mytilinidion resinicola TaxID=574789 RepID=A0A6A6YR34_9PEZI|nr:uncharacterized protein BDZ99DRAFT_508508 [Mytilinidion resinicola]KAF2811240.1 hypothetical protein BDZ99DRAFT_508508 [Mytilinidion resinicola]
MSVIPATNFPLKQQELPRTIHDVENGRKRSSRLRFRDAIVAMIDRQRATEFKRKLIDGINREELESYRKSEEELKDIKNKKVRHFYEDQNERLDDWMEVDTLVMTLADDVVDSMNPRDLDHDGVAEAGGPLQGSGVNVECFLPDEAREKRRKEARSARLAININVVANILLLAAKCIAAGYSSSLSLIASLVDSALDLLCTLIIWSTNKLIMVISFLQILEESFEQLLPSGKHKVTQLPPVAISAMVSTIVVKGIIWFGCIQIKTTQVQALAQDCKTDVFFNTLCLLFPVIGYQLDVWWLDHGKTCFENVLRLTGVSAPERIARKMMFLAWRFAPVVDGYKAVKTYHAGDGVWVEMDVVLDEQTPLRRAHDVAETLQYCCEGLGEVDRAFVSMDYTFQGPSGHATENI